MNYLCLVYHAEIMLEALSASEQKAMLGELLDYNEELRKRGHYIASDTLQPAQTATTIRVRNGKLSLNAGPCAATQKQLSGFYLINARDLNEAIRLAARMPPARLGCIEVRPIQELVAQ